MSKKMIPLHVADQAVAACEAEIQKLKHQVQNLKAAGDAMEMTLQADFNGCPYEPMIVREAMLKWRLAKSQP